MATEMGKLDAETIKKMVEGKLQPGEVDPKLVREYERAAKENTANCKRHC